MFKNVTKTVVWGPFTHPAQFKLPLDASGRLKRDQIFTRYIIFEKSM
jgi:hypothetical protein